MKLRTLIRTAARREAGSVGDAARRAAEALRQDPRVQDTAARLRTRAQEFGGAARSQADSHLERLIERAHTRSGDPVPDDVAAVLARRRHEREARAAQARARAALLAQGETAEQRRVLTLLAEVTPWAGGQPGELRYTGLLDRLAPSGSPEAEMPVHRALWTLAERRVLAVSPHGAVTACPLPTDLAVTDLGAGPGA
ncbi:hypothetical protein [Deinococcus budaensis]|uniref:Uncharacterized protein n=1 Tax=Deinococcus budaensis TaxID=1665626 RepID=A0A7W8GE18_9DEIO|nr:hypothetical protein [Deinococcus budaensis]MBB5233891.1 hypothetical protein [Deinococcus budaensis]